MRGILTRDQSAMQTLKHSWGRSRFRMNSTSCFYSDSDNYDKELR